MMEDGMELDEIDAAVANIGRGCREKKRRALSSDEENDLDSEKVVSSNVFPFPFQQCY